MAVKPFAGLGLEVWAVRADCIVVKNSHAQCWCSHGGRSCGQYSDLVLQRRESGA